jgi:hypothetical protein
MYFKGSSREISQRDAETCLRGVDTVLVWFSRGCNTCAAWLEASVATSEKRGRHRRLLLENFAEGLHKCLQSICSYIILCSVLTHSGATFRGTRMRCPSYDSQKEKRRLQNQQDSTNELRHTVHLSTKVQHVVRCTSQPVSKAPQANHSLPG